MDVVSAIVIDIKLLFRYALRQALAACTTVGKECVTACIRSDGVKCFFETATLFKGSREVEDIMQLVSKALVAIVRIPTGKAKIAALPHAMPLLKHYRDVYENRNREINVALSVVIAALSAP